MVMSYLEGDTKKATKLQLDTLNLTKNLFSEVNPIPVKAAYNMIGFNAGIPRLPLIEMSDNGQKNLKKALKDYGVIK
jgi:4-hydroxy-tetrahydrodipicolinate synthase